MRMEAGAPFLEALALPLVAGQWRHTLHPRSLMQSQLPPLPPCPAVPFLQSLPPCLPWISAGAAPLLPAPPSEGHVNRAGIRAEPSHGVTRRALVFRGHPRDRLMIRLF